MAVVAAPPGQHVTNNNESRWNFPHTDSCDLPLQNPRSNLGFQRSHCEGLDDSLGRLCFHDRFFAKHHLLGSFGCWLLSCLDHAKAREGELAHLLQLTAGCKCVCKGTLAHGLCCSFHCLWSHGDLLGKVLQSKNKAACLK